jgi:hypothetical protein
MCEGLRETLQGNAWGGKRHQVMARAGITASADPEIVVSLEKLVAHVQDLDAGDMVIAWEPLASGLESKHRLTRIAEFRLWVSLYCHNRWQRGALRPLKALEFFTAGSGLGPRP